MGCGAYDDLLSLGDKGHQKRECIATVRIREEPGCAWSYQVELPDDERTIFGLYAGDVPQSVERVS